VAGAVPAGPVADPVDGGLSDPAVRARDRLPGPATGDAFGAMLQAALGQELAGDRPAVAEIVERDDGVLAIGPAAFYLAGPAEWPEYERAAAERLAGRVLDVGAGAGRVALFLQARGIPVTALDVSPGAAEVCRRRGVRDPVCAGIAQYAASGERFDSFALFGRNLGLLGSRQQAPALLAALASLARPGARVVGVGVDPPAEPDPVTRGYAHRNQAAGQLPGQRRLRSRFRDLASPWFDFLWCSAGELDELVAGSRWRLAEVVQRSGPSYAAVLALRD